MSKILVVEDEKLLGEMYRDKFTEAGFDVEWLNSAEEAIEYLEKKIPDLVLLDILLPRENGLSVLRRIKENPKLAKLPVIAFSNFDDKEIKMEALKLGVKDYLLKTDYTPNQIIEKIREYIKK